MVPVCSTPAHSIGDRTDSYVCRRNVMGAKTVGGEVRRSCARKVRMVNDLFSEVTEQLKDRICNQSPICSDAQAVACRTLQEIWDDTLNRVFCGNACVVSKWSDRLNEEM